MISVDELKKKLNIIHDKDLAPVFGRKPSVVTAWRTEGLPAAIEIKARELLGERFGTTERPDGAFDIPVPSRRIPIISWAQAGTNGFFVDSHVVGQGFGDINCPYDVTDPNAYALIISGDSMAHRYEAGDIVVVSPAAGVQAGDYAVVKLTDGQVMAKRVKEKNEQFIFESVNPEYDLIECQKENIVFMHRIVWVKQRG